MSTTPDPHVPLVVHLGLPKTATTFLQYSVFPQTVGRRGSGFIYVHRSRGSDAARLTRRLKMYQRVDDVDVDGALAKVNTTLAQIRRTHHVDHTSPTTLISNENISVPAGKVWDEKGPTPERVAVRLGLWLRSLGLPQTDSIRIILGIRRQDQWLGSRYAQSALHSEHFCQADFDQRLTRLCAGPLNGSMQWLDYSEARRQLMTTLGDQSVFILPMELLGDDPEPILDRLGRFVGYPGLIDLYGRVSSRDTHEQRRNVSSIGRNVWKLKGRADQIILSEDLAAKIRNRFRASNEILAEEIGVDLRSLGY